MKIKQKMLICLAGALLLGSVPLSAQKKLAEFPFNDHIRALNVNTAIGFGQFRVKVSATSVLVQSPGVVTDGDEGKAMFFRFNAGYAVATNNISIALAPKPGNDVKITHLEFRVRFGSINSGNAGIFISKDPLTQENTQLWTCGNNRTFNKYRSFVVPVPDSQLSYSDSETDSIRFVIAQGTNTQGMYFDDLVVYGIVNSESKPAVNISVDASAVTKELADRPSGANTCWLMDSDIKWPRSVSNESRFEEMQIGTLRYPYGHLADNYLWHKPGEYETVAETGPIPTVASPDTPAQWSWAVNASDGTFLKDMSFDEFIAICKRRNIEPLIVVNAQSYTYPGGPDYQTLLKSAAEWVKYANITKKYGIKYWQIGNEVEHQSSLTMAVYTDLFLDFATAMKAVDPSIHVGTGVLSNTNWNKDVLNRAGNLCSFVSTHNYLFNSTIAPGGYRSWYQTTGLMITNTVETQNMLSSAFSDRPEIEMLVTETNVTGGDFPDMGNIDLYKALCWFEMDMNHLALKNTRYTYFWGSHSPWSGETNPGDIGCLLENSDANAVRPSGKVIQLVNTYLKNRWLDAPRVNGFIRTYASVSADGKELSVFFLNKNLYAETINLNISAYDVYGAQSVKKVCFTGSGFDDINPSIEEELLSEAPSRLVLPGVSITVVEYKRSGGDTRLPPVSESVPACSFDGEFLRIERKTPEQGTIAVYCPDGRKTYEMNVLPGERRVDLSRLSSGIYIVHFRSGEINEKLKIIR